MTVNYIKIPADPSQAPVVCQTEDTDPYKIAKDELDAFAEKVYTHELHHFCPGLHMFVDEMGAYKQEDLRLNPRAMIFYPYAPIFGDAILIQLVTVMTSDGPDLATGSIDSTVFRKVQGLWRNN